LLTAGAVVESELLSIAAELVAVWAAETGAKISMAEVDAASQHYWSLVDWLIPHSRHGSIYSCRLPHCQYTL